MTEERAAKINGVLDKRQNDITVIMENVRDPHNIAAVMRTCDAIGISEIFVLNTSINTHKRFGRSSSSSAQKWMKANQFANMDECLAVIRTKYKKILATHLSAEAKSIHDTDFTQSCAIVFGNEKEGISDELLKKCDGNILIPQVGMISSLNISVACAVTIYEAFRQKNIARHYAQRKLNQTEINELAEYWNIYEKL